MRVPFQRGTYNLCCASLFSRADSFYQPNLPPLWSYIAVNDVSRFSYRETKLFDLSNTAGPTDYLYERYLVNGDRFINDCGTHTIDILNSSHLVLYRRVGMLDSECFNLAQFKIDAAKLDAVKFDTIRDAKRSTYFAAQT